MLQYVKVFSVTETIRNSTESMFVLYCGVVVDLSQSPSCRLRDPVM